MRGKKAKALRRIAREATVGRPKVGYRKHKRNGNIAVDPTTTQGFYLHLKGLAK